MNMMNLLTSLGWSITRDAGAAYHWAVLRRNTKNGYPKEAVIHYDGTDTDFLDQLRRYVSGYNVYAEAQKRLYSTDRYSDPLFLMGQKTGRGTAKLSAFIADEQDFLNTLQDTLAALTKGGAYNG